MKCLQCVSGAPIKKTENATEVSGLSVFTSELLGRWVRSIDEFIEEPEYPEYEVPVEVPEVPVYDEKIETKIKDDGKEGATIAIDLQTPGKTGIKKKLGVVGKAMKKLKKMKLKAKVGMKKVGKYMKSLPLVKKVSEKLEKFSIDNMHKQFVDYFGGFQFVNQDALKNVTFMNMNLENLQKIFYMTDEDWAASFQEFEEETVGLIDTASEAFDKLEFMARDFIGLVTK